MKPPLRRGAAFFAVGGVRKALSVSDISRQGKDGLSAFSASFCVFPVTAMFFADFISKSERFISKKEMKRNFLCELLRGKVKESYICISHL